MDSTVQGNFAYGVSITGAGNRVGGTATGARNVISGNNGDGVAINGTGASNNVVQGNFIGTDLSGTLDRGNGSSGVNVFASGNSIGGSLPGAGNVIAGNNGSGVNVSLPANDTTIKDEDTASSDWLEIYNKGQTTVGLTGCHLTDQVNDRTKWTFRGGQAAPWSSRSSDRPACWIRWLTCDR